MVQYSSSPPPPPPQCEMCAAGLWIFKRRVIRLFPVQLPKHSERHHHEIRLLQQQKYITSPIRACFHTFRSPF